MSFLEAPSADLYSKMRFWSDFRPQYGPKVNHFQPKRHQKGYPANEPKSREASWSRPGHDLALKTVQGCIFIDFGSVFGRFRMDFGQLWKDFLLFCMIATPFFTRIQASTFSIQGCLFIDFEWIQVQLWTRYV